MWPPLDQLGHLAVEEGEQQGADVGAVDVGVGHQDDAVVAQLLGLVVVLADAGAERGDQGGDLLALQQLVEARLLDVEDLALERQDRLELAVAALLGRAACGVALDEVELAQRGVLFLAVGELAGQADAVEHALAARHLARLARGVARPGGLDDLVADGLGVERVLEQEVAELAGDDFFHRRAGLGRHQLHLGLAGELGVGHLDREHAGQAFAHVVTGDVDLGLLGDLVFFDVLVDDARHRRAQAGEVGAAVGLRDVVGVAQHLFLVAVVPLHGDFDRELGVVAVAGGDAGGAGGVEDVGVQHRLGAVDVLDEALDAAGEGEVFLLAGALVDETDLDAVVEEGELAQALGEDVVVVLDGAEDLLVGQVMHLGAALGGLADDARRADLDAIHDLDDAVLRLAALELEQVALAVAGDGDVHPLGQRIHAGHAHAVQAAGDLVAVLVELAAGVQHAHDDLGGAALGLVLVVHLDADRDAAAVVGDRDRVVGVDGDDDVVAVTGQGLVDGVVHDLEDHVVQAGAVGGVADVHAGALAHRFQPFELLDAGFVVVFVRLGGCGGLVLRFGHGHLGDS
jgi:hypothetical protein